MDLVGIDHTTLHHHPPGQEKRSLMATCTHLDQVVVVRMEQVAGGEESLADHVGVVIPDRV